jgi:hypothetical protein
MTIEKKCRVVIERDNGQLAVCGGEIEYWKTVSENKGRDRKIHLCRCKKCGLLYSTTQEI